MRQRWRRRAGAWALLALLLQLALPYLTVQQAAAAAAGRASFVICTGAGLVWINPDGTPAKGGEGDGAAFHCPACLAKQLALAAVPPSTPADTPPPGRALPVAGSAREAGPAATSTPPLPARGPPLPG